ncbi:MAG: PAS domain S-box protein, partial [Candidatus Marinimicrobia bacterium]|nr:PAS domain S-box protein [Candidatus Neomarinimicrobiota bacterium]
MNFSLTPQVDILIISALIAFSLALLSWRRGKRKDAYYFGWLMFALSIWSFTYGLVFITSNPDTQFILYSLHYLWNLSIPLFILAFILAFTNNTGYLHLRYFSLLALPLILTTFILFSPHLRQFIFTSVTVTPEAAHFIIQVEPGWLFWINFAIAYAIVFLALSLLLQRINQAKSKLVQKQASLLLGVILIPPVSKLLYLLDIGLIAEFDPTPLTLIVAGIVVYFSVLQYSFLELTPYTQRRLLNSLSDGVLILDHGNRIIKSNRSAREIFRRSKKELHKKPADLVLPVDDILQDAESNTTDQAHESLWIANNRTYEVRKENLLNNKGYSHGLLIILRDITDYITYEEQLQERNIYIESIFNHLPIGIAAHDLNTGKMLEMNENFEKIYGWPSRDMKSVDEFFNLVYPEPERRAYWKKRIESDIASGDPKRMRWEGVRIQTQTGEERVVNAYNIPISGSNIMISTVEDVTDNHTIAEALRESEKNFRDIFQNMQHGFYRARPDATIALINPAAAQMLGHTYPDDLIGEKMHERPEFET